VLTKKGENRLLVFERKFPRTIFDPKIVDGLYRSRYNFEIDREFNSPNDSGVVQSNKLRYVGHMMRGAQDLPQKALLRAVPEGRRNQGRPISRWRDRQNSPLKLYSIDF
jgi:hypothetical protein